MGTENEPRVPLNAKQRGGFMPLEVRLAKITLEHFEKAMEIAGGIQTVALNYLGISKSGFYTRRKMALAIMDQWDGGATVKSQWRGKSHVMGTELSAYARRKWYGVARTIQSRLLFLGVPAHMVDWNANNAHFIPVRGRNSFWQRPVAYHWALLEEARKRYRLAVRELHPDKTGDDSTTKLLSEKLDAWEFVHRQFASRGFELRKEAA